MEITVDYSKKCGRIKPLNAVNNGPTKPGVRDSYNNFESYKALEIPFARTHDSIWSQGFDGNFLVDIHCIFRNFDADENDPKSYIFEPTDCYLENIKNTGTQVFYRLGASIEHGFKFGTYPPADFEKWARICEHIIMHYNEGWANGFNWGIEYWEIWNEPTCRNADGSNPCWQGTDEEFIRFYITSASYLKKRFPNLKIGGPATVSAWDENFNNMFLKGVSESGAPLDFYSYHWYGAKPQDFALSLKKAREDLDKYGFYKTETILNEYNYIRGWQRDDWKYSLATEKNIKGASFLAALLAEAQANPLDMLMYYDARLCGMCGLFDRETCAPLKPYYTFKMFKKLRDLGECIETESADDVYSCGATDGKNGALMLTYFNDDDEADEKDVQIAFKGGKAKVNFFILDENNNLELTRSEILSGVEAELYIKVKKFSSYLVCFEAI